MNQSLKIIVLIGITCFANAQADKPFCFANQFWDGQKCEQCMDGCVCTSFLGCNSCISGYYYMASTKTCERCYGDSIDECCYEMSTATTTTNGGSLMAMRAESCKSQYAHPGSSLGNSGVCMQIDDCAKFSDEGICTICFHGFWLDYSDNQCYECSTIFNLNCETCSTLGQCQTCKMGYYMAVTTKDEEKPASKCLQCKDGCICDNGDNLCKSCFNDNTYYLKDDTNPEQVCEACSIQYQNSVTCNAKAILTCLDFYKPSADNQTCVVCPDNCLFEGCAYDTQKNDTVCSQCRPHYYLQEGQCIECDTGSYDYCNGIDGINQVQCGGKIRDQENSFSSTFPHEGQRYLVNVKNAEKTAKECVTNVNNCMKIKENNDKGKDLCESCYTTQGWYLTADAKCLYCPKEITNCSECTVKENGLICKTCLTGYYKDGDTTCSECQDGCSSCNAIDNCLVNCDLTYRTVTNAGKKTCEQCSNSAGNGKCAVCQAAADQCESCLPGYRLWKKTEAGGVAATIRCEACESNCLKCDGARKICTLCSDDYFLTSNGVCKSPPSNCASWTRKEGSCELCDYGYRLIDANGRQTCVVCGSPEIGYLNCQNQCSKSGSWPYRRDGVLYTESLESDRHNKNPDPNASSTTLQSNVINIVFNFILLIIIALFF